MDQGRIVHNTKWIIAGKVVQSLMQMVIGMISARYLGPSSYGLINYASSVVAFAVPVMQLGMNATLVQEYVDHPEKEGEILGTALAMNIVAAVACMAGVISFTIAANSGDTVTILVCALYSVTLLSQALEMVQYWFQAKLLAKYSSVAAVVAYAVVSAYKIFLLVTGKNVFWFALSHAVEYGTTGILYIILYRRCGNQKCTVSLARARDMFSRSKYYILATLMITAYQSVDHIMLKNICSAAENGFYTTAGTCMVVGTFVYNAIVESARPVILEARKHSRQKFEHGIISLYSILIYLTFLQSVVFFFLAKYIVFFLYGDAYRPAVPVLQILIWQLPLSYMEITRGIWLLGEGKHNVLWVVNLCAMIGNITLNSLMIPTWGACGAAVASVLTQFITNFVVGFFMKPIRRNNYLLLKGFDPRYLVEMVKQFLQK